MVAAFAGCGAQAAFINSGSLRLNQDLAAGSEITRRQVEELFAYPSPLRLLRLDGRTLGQVASHAAVGWPGAGNWLQVSGISYSHDTGTGTVSDVRLRTAGGSRPVQPDEEVLVVANDYLVDPSGDQDGYIMLNPGQIVEDCAADGTDLKEIVIEALRTAGPEGIAPETDGRIRQVGAGAQPPCSKNERTCGR
jgi:2',3'-cyclic-nucleotide 2'-phosphodiesterase (5'-nucleotidase family)